MAMQTIPAVKSLLAALTAALTPALTAALTATLLTTLGALPAFASPALATQASTAEHRFPSAASSAKKPAPDHSAAAKSPLPEVFDGWQLDGKVKPLPTPQDADSAHAAALVEYGYTSGATATYSRTGETLSIRALRFGDATGAYGAYSFYRQNRWPRENIGTGAASDNAHVVFWKGNVFVDATFSHVDPMAGSALRELARELTVLTGNKAVPPPVLMNLPQRSIDGQTTHYALGPAGYSAGVLPAYLVGFDRGAEAVTANYKLRSGPATLTLIDYPTPQLAAAQEAAIRAYINAGDQPQHSQPQHAGDQPQHTWTEALLNSDKASLEVRRSGPLVALVSGDAVPEESHKLLETVNYDATLMSIPQPMQSEVSKTAKLLGGIAALVGVGSLAAILLGLFLGGGRALWRLARGKPISALQEAEFTHLDLRD